MDTLEIERLLGGPPRVALEDIIGHSRLPEARKLYIERFLELYGGDPFLVRLLIETGRFALYNIIVVLEAAQDLARPESWLTVGHLKQKMTEFGLAGERQIAHLVARLCDVGFLESHPCEQDRRVRLLRPTEKLRAHDRDWLVAHYAPLTVLYPEHDYGPVMQRDPDFQAVHRRVSASFMSLGAKLLLAAPDMMLFLNRAAGYPVLAALLHAAMAQADHSLAAVPYAETGRRFGVSGTHVRQLLVAAEQAGLVKLHSRGGHRVEVLPQLWSSHDRGIAGGMYFHDIVYVAATQAWH